MDRVLSSLVHRERQQKEFVAAEVRKVQEELEAKLARQQEVLGTVQSRLELIQAIGQQREKAAEKARNIDLATMRRDLDTEVSTVLALIRDVLQDSEP